MDILERISVWIDVERAAHNQNHVRHLAQAQGEISRLRGVVSVAVHRLSRAADAVSDGDLSDPRIDQLSEFAIEIEEMSMPAKEGE